MNICVFCSSKSDLSATVFDQSRDLIRTMAQRQDTLVYGGGAVGLMGFIADTMISEKGRTIGVMPESVFDHEVAHQGLTQLIYTKDMLDRKKKMIELSDAFIVLPGGIGTMDEAIEVMTWKTVYKFTKPIVFLNIDGFWDPFLTMLKAYEQTRLFYPETMQSFKVVNTVEELIGALSC